MPNNLEVKKLTIWRRELFLILQSLVHDSLTTISNGDKFLQDSASELLEYLKEMFFSIIYTMLLLECSKL